MEEIVKVDSDFQMSFFQISFTVVFNTRLLLAIHVSENREKSALRYKRV